ncbi:hypothetical protein PGT21_050073 [Puccinia graminis f. sp. tritici]|uniref:Uncharacterized protein n=1 Tax=Puccinia graminis f. sp. tritici TaxID=56615 RepID=A0A5B0N2I3_PUCGR|nr:hypothetical protein PGT21_050073 [Puccinia graminis f. sp. tritici]
MEDSLKFVYTVQWNNNEEKIKQEKSEALSRILVLNESGDISLNNWEMNVLHVILLIEPDLQSPQTISDYQNHLQAVHEGQCYGCQEPYFHNLQPILDPKSIKKTDQPLQPVDMKLSGRI